jgi:hypothetical protein
MDDFAFAIALDQQACIARPAAVTCGWVMLRMRHAGEYVPQALLPAFSDSKALLASMPSPPFLVRGARRIRPGM